MGLVDAFSAEDRVQVKFSDFYNLIKGCTQRDMLMNGAKCEVPHQFIREMMSGKKEPEALPSTTTDFYGAFVEDVSGYAFADKDHIFLLTDDGYEHTPGYDREERAVGEPMRGFVDRVPKEWLEKGYVALSEKTAYEEAHPVNPFAQEG